MSQQKQAVEIPTFIFHTKWRKILQPYEPDVRLEVYEAICDYMEKGVTQELKPLALMAFSFIKYDLDEARRNYLDKVEKCRKAGIASQKARETNISADAAEDSTPSLPMSREEVVAKFLSSYPILVEGFLKDLGCISKEKLSALMLKVLLRWESRGWCPSPIEKGADEFQAGRLLNWLRKEQEIESKPSQNIKNETNSADRFQKRRSVEPSARSAADYTDCPL